jgi:Tfp pilus assembly protein PilO
MKDLMNRLLANIHIIILLYCSYVLYTQYEEHTVAVEAVTSQFPAVDAEIASTKKRIKEIDEFRKKAEEYRARVEEVAKNIEAVQRQLPADTNDNQIVTLFRDEMTNLNIKSPGINPGNEEVSTYFISKNYNLKANGTFLQFLIFVERLGNADRIFNIKSMKLSNSNPNQKGRFQVITGEYVIQAFRFNPAFKVERGFDPATAPAGVK